MAKYGLDLVIFGNCNSVVLWFGAGGLLFSFLLLSSTKVFQSALVPVLTSIYSRTSPSLERWLKCNSYIMKTITFLSSLLFLFSCSKRGTLDKYYQIVDSSNKVVYYTKINGVFIITREATVDEHLQTSKNILKRNIKPEEQRNITPTYPPGQVPSELIA